MITKFLRLVEFVLGWTLRAVVRLFAFAVGTVHDVWDRAILWFTTWTGMFVVALYSLWTRRRMSHDNGILTRGRVRLVDGEGLPRTEFFGSKREFACRCRFASVSYLDDARLVGRGVGLKFADSRGKSPLDLLMDTGRTSPFNSVRSFWGLLVATAKNRGPNLIRYMQIAPERYVGGIGTLRRNPETFAQLHYYSKVPVLMTLKDGSDAYVKFRLAPWNRGADTGLPEDDDLLDWAWCLGGVRPGETRSRNYLKRELKERLNSGPIRFHLQLQHRPVRDGDLRDILDPSLDWDEYEHPFVDVAEVVIDEVLDATESAMTMFSTGNRPESMRFPRGKSIYDPASLNDLRALSGIPRAARVLAVKLFGMPRAIREDRPAGSTPMTPYAEPLELGDPEPLMLPQNERPADRAARRQLLHETRELYPLTVPGNMPTYCGEVPPAEQFDRVQKSRMFSDIMSTAANLGLAGISRFDRQPRTLATWDTYYPMRSIPAVHARWRTDVEFGRQRLNGVNPTLIEKCLELPAKFPVTDEIVHGLLPRNTTLADELAAGRLFLTDHAILRGLPTHDNAYLTAPICLFHLSSDGSLLPLAIQLGQNESSDFDKEAPTCPIFTPNDPPWLWLTVKTFAQSADAAYHEVYAHLMRTHMMSETFYLCARRTLAARHPVMELLAPHYHDTIAINDAARQNMLAPDGPLPRTMAAGYQGTIQLLQRAFDDYRLEDLYLQRDLERRGLMDRNEEGRFVLPRFYFRDDGLQVLAAIHQWVGSILGHFYRSKADVRHDDELADFLSELADPERGNVKGMPRVKTPADLIDFVTHLIFTASAEHSAVNNGQNDYFGYIPSVPGAMHKPPPMTKDELSEEWLVDALPSPMNSSIQIAMVHLLSTKADWPIGHYPYGFFQGHKEIVVATKRFRARLDRISVAIRSRNATASVPYPYLDPRLMGKSTLI